MENFEKEINRIKIFIPSFLSSLSAVRAMVRVYLREHRISELDEIQLLSVVDELTTNAVEHAYRYDKGEIKIVLNFYKKTIFLTVEDFGKGYDEKLDSKEDGGFGLSIARKLVDVFEIEKKTKGTVFKVEKRIKEAV
ncbi:anti-sigma factor [Fusobacterium animalis]|uniref:Anti-sigma factor n=1 Tax=Fusobacterium animalis TaxID=76859 RepID=A0A2G9FKY6_9FUSO|nr:ATP-binding protein [Fusobacterium animalis]PIM91357.1 anti-sigma factor [Fusobacterium animalis]PIM93782.1 anti-sigma factor [Fusobacterium animalis]